LSARFGSQRPEFASGRGLDPLEDHDVSVAHDYELSTGLQPKSVADILRDHDLTFR